MKKISIIIILILALTGCTSSITSIVADKVYETINQEENYVLIDVRSFAEYKSGHIKTAINIPVEKINEIENKNIAKDTMIIVYCQSGSRSEVAAESLSKLGYNNVYDMGSMTNWTHELEN